MRGQKHILNSAFCKQQCWFTFRHPWSCWVMKRLLCCCMHRVISPSNVLTSPSGSKGFKPPPLWLTGSNGLALSSYLQFKLLTAEQHPVVLQPRSLFGLSISCLSYLIEIIILSSLSAHFAKQKQLFRSGLVYSPISSSEPCLCSEFIFPEPCKCWSPNHEIRSVSFSQYYV